MIVSNVGGVIAAASKKVAQPLCKIGSITAVKRIVQTFQQAGIFPIVVVTGAEEDEVRYQLSAKGVIFLPINHSDAPQLIESAKIGFSFLQSKCEKVVFTPVNCPMFSPSTLHKLLVAEGEIVTPSFLQKGGHPIVLSTKIIPQILAYQGENGLRGVISTMKDKRQWVEVDDKGILISVYDTEMLKTLVEQHNKEILQPVVRIKLEKEDVFFDARAKLLLLLISETESVRKACGLMSLSYSKAWDMLNMLEKELGYPVVSRKHGGDKGGKTLLTEKGFLFLKVYQQFEQRVFLNAHEEFNLLLKNDIFF